MLPRRDYFYIIKKEDKIRGIYRGTKRRINE